MLLIHFDSSAVPTDAAFGEGDSNPEGQDRAHLVQLLRRWPGQNARHVFALLPEHLRESSSRFIDSLGSIAPIWYAPDGIAELPSAPTKRPVWIVNGGRLPIIDWAAARTERGKSNADVLIFGTAGGDAGPRYPETVVVGEHGQVDGVQRHYCDSPGFADMGCGDAVLLASDPDNATSVVNHVLMRGWGLESVGALTRRLGVRWSATPCVTSDLVSPTPSTVFGGIETAFPSRNGNRGARSERNGKTNGSAASRVDPVARHPTLAAYLLAKRTIDVVAATAGLVFLSPVLAGVALLVKLTSPGPVLFADKRQGLGGKEFRCWKFRSMRVGADKLQDELRQQNEVDGPQFKIDRDPRLTPIGGWLRRTNLDELPQLFNVLVGTMSLVGPRPSPDKENQFCPAWRRTRLSIKPGITGLWQVLRMREGGSDFQEWIYYDVEYARHRSLWLDAWILLYTPLSMVAHRKLDGFARRLERHGICMHSGRLDTTKYDLHPPDSTS